MGLLSFYFFGCLFMVGEYTSFSSLFKTYGLRALVAFELFLDPQ